MITSAKSYTKSKKKKDSLNPRTNGKSKVLQTKSHKEAYTHTHPQKEKKEKKMCIYIYKKIKQRKRAAKLIRKSTNDNKL